LSISIDVNFVLDVINILITTDPNWSSSDIWKVFWINFILFLWSENIEVFISFLGWLVMMNYFIKMVMNDLTKINNGSFLDLNFTFVIQLDSSVVNETQVSEIKLSVDRNNHELCFPKLLVIRNVVMTGFTLSNLIDSSISFNEDLNVLEFLSIY